MYGSIVNSVNYPACPLGRPSVPRLTVLHKNVPNVIGSITAQLSAEGINIENMTNQSRGAYAYTVLDVAVRPSDAILDALKAMDTVYRVRML